MVNETAWAGAAETVKYGVYLGMWTNWSRGRVLGATLTLSREDGNYLISFTAFFIGLISTRFWRIVCFMLHNSLSTSTPRDALYHQQQAILRNSDSADSGLLTFFQLVWAWRKNTKRVFVRMWPVIATAAFFTVAFTIAGGFSSSISTGIGNDVLLDGSNCAILNPQVYDNESRDILNPYSSRRANTAANYAQQCYGTNTSGVFDCGTFAKARIPSSVDNQTACPFSKGLCRTDESLRLDTGYIDSHEHLGVNAPFNERVIFRTVLQCAPLVTEGYTSDVSTPAENYTTYDYGRTSNSERNYTTYRASNSDTQYQTEGNEFKVHALLGLSLNGSTFPRPEFTARSGLFPTDGDLILTFLTGNGVRFLEKTDDPWYRGNVGYVNTTWRHENYANFSYTYYRMDQAASPMACLQKFQFCNPALPEEGRCGPLAGFLDAQVQAAHLFNITYEQMRDMDPEQMIESGILKTPAASRFLWLLMILTLAVTDVTALINVLGPYSLASQQSLSRGSSTLSIIPSNQWQLDAKNWWAIYMASLQAGMVNIASGSQDPTLKPYEIPPFNAHIQKLCNNQKILSSEYTSFSVFGLCFIYVVGVLIVATSYLLEPIQAWLYRHRNLKEYAYLEWTANATLQLQRMAYQGLESGQWSRYTDVIPLREPGNIMADLPRSYPLDKKKNQADVEQGHSAEKPTGAVITTVQTASSSQVEPDSSTMTPGDNNSHLDKAGEGGRQSVEAVSPVHTQWDEPVHWPAFPHLDAIPQQPVDAALLEAEQPRLQDSKDPAVDTPECDGGPARDLICTPVEGRRGT